MIQYNIQIEQHAILKTHECTKIEVKERINGQNPAKYVEKMPKNRKAKSKWSTIGQKVNKLALN